MAKYMLSFDMSVEQYVTKVWLLQSTHTLLRTFPSPDFFRMTDNAPTISHPAPSRDDQVMQRFLEGTLNVGPSFALQRHGKPVSFVPKGKERHELMQWFEERRIQMSNAT